MPREDYYYKCPKCKRKIEYGVKKCTNCKTKIDWSEEENTKEVKVNTRLGVGIALIIINIVLALADTISCKNSYMQQELCSFTNYEYGILYVIGRFLFAIIGTILIYRWWKYPKYKEITISDEKEEDEEDLDEYDEDLED